MDFQIHSLFILQINKLKWFSKIMLDLDLVKNHCNVDKFFLDDDKYLMTLIDVSKDTILAYIDQSDENLAKIYDSDQQEFKVSPLVQAQLLLIGHFYANREAVSYGVPNKVPFGFEYLLQPYKNYDYKEANGILSGKDSQK